MATCEPPLCSVTVRRELVDAGTPAPEELPAFVSQLSELWERAAKLVEEEVAFANRVVGLRDEVRKYLCAQSAAPRYGDLSYSAESALLWQTLDSLRVEFIRSAGLALGGSESVIWEASDLDWLADEGFVPTRASWTVPDGGFQRAWAELCERYRPERVIAARLRKLRGEVATALSLSTGNPPIVDSKGRLVVEVRIHNDSFRAGSIKERLDPLARYASQAGLEPAFSGVLELPSPRYLRNPVTGVFQCGTHFKVRLFKEYMAITFSPQATEAFRVFMAEYA